MRRKRIYIDLDNTVADYLGMAEKMGIEAVVIGKNTNITDFKRELRLNEVYYR